MASRARHTTQSSYSQVALQVLQLSSYGPKGRAALDATKILGKKGILPAPPFKLAACNSRPEPCYSDTREGKENLTSTPESVTKHSTGRWLLWQMASLREL